jgi:hypothetical protein
MFEINAQVNEDGTYKWGATTPDGAPIPFVRILDFLNRAQADVIAKMVAPAEPPTEATDGG